MSRPLVPFAALVFLFCMSPPPARAQYLYLDANGNGVHDTGDCNLSSGPRDIDIYLNTTANRDNSPGACPDGQVSTFSVILRATGPFSNVSYTSRLLSGVLRAQDATDIYIESTSANQLAGGLLYVGTLHITMASGIALEIASHTNLGAPSREYVTMFGTPCDGAQFDNTFRFGEDWFDADGTCGPSFPTVAISGTVFPDPGGATPPCPLGAPTSGLIDRVVQIQPGGALAHTNGAGLYRFGVVAPGPTTVTLLPRASWAQTCPPSAAPLTFNVIAGQNIVDANFAVTPTASVQDLSACLSSTRARPGFNMIYTVVGLNLGTITTVATLSMTLPPEITSIVSASDAGTLAGGTVTWPPVSMDAGKAVTRYVTVNIPASMPSHTMLLATATIEPLSGDANTSDNSCSNTIEVRGSYDPNEKHVSPSGRILRTNALQYHIDFQNVGTDTAFTIVVRDSLDPNLDASTFRSGLSRHPYSVETAGGLVVWTFSNIELPDSTASEPNSHGWVEYAIMPSSSAPDGAVLNNFANIYFDFNSPVQTNAVADTIDSAPFLYPVPDRTVIEGSPVDQSISASDPEGDFLALTLVSGPPWAGITSTGPSTGNLHLAPQSGDAGPYTVTLRASDGILNHQQTASVNVLAVTGVGMTELFKAQEIRLTSLAPRLCVQIGTTSGAFRPHEIDPASLVMKWAGDRNGLRPALARDQGGETGDAICFKADEVRAAFSSLVETATVDVWWEGRLRSGETFAGVMPLTVQVAAGHLAASFTPNPFNPNASLKFRTRGSGFARVRLYRMDGRVVRTLLDVRSLPSGYHVLDFNGVDDAGNHVASGLYFYQIETAEGSQSGRVTLLK